MLSPEALSCKDIRSAASHRRSWLKWVFVSVCFACQDDHRQICRWHFEPSADAFGCSSNTYLLHACLLTATSAPSRGCSAVQDGEMHEVLPAALPSHQPKPCLPLL